MPKIKPITLRRRYASALILVFLCAALFFASTSFLIKEQSAYARAINLSGKERMLCITIQHAGHHYYHEADESSRKKLLEAIVTFEDIEEELFPLHGAPKKGLKADFIDQARLIMQNRDEKAFVYVDTHADELLKLLDDIVSSLQKESETKVANIQKSNMLLFVLFVLLLFAIGKYIFIPAEKEIKLRTRQLMEANEALEHKVSQEVKKRRQQENLLMHQSRMADMGEMIGNIAHQWRQPLNALGLVVANIKYAYDQGRLDEAFIEKTVDKSTRLVQKMSSTIEDFSSFFRPDKKVNVFSLHEVVTEVLSLLEGIFKHNNIAVDERVPEAIRIESYKNEFAQVLLNLLSNAKDALIGNAVENPLITITAYYEGESLFLRIEDNAGGIPETVLPKIFEPYFTTKEQGKGTGIGLYMSKTIIKEHMKGEIYVQNGEAGAVFTIKLAKGMS